MRNLLNFILRYSKWFVFAILMAAGTVWYFSSGTYRQALWLTSAGRVTSGISSVRNNVTGYFALRTINHDLQQSNARLENEVLNLQEELRKANARLAGSDTVRHEERFGYVIASVINNSTRHPSNYFTIDKGTADGVKPGMGVVDQNGVVGIVNVCGKHTSRVISVLHHKQSFSVRIRNSNVGGMLSWRGTDPKVAYIVDFPRHVKFHVGDTIVTSGFSTSFPEGIGVGTVMGQVRGEDDNYFTLKVRLFPDFNSLSTVRVIKDIYKNEIDSLILQQRDPETGPAHK